MQNYEHILVALDESSMSYAASEHARELAKAFNSKVTLVSIIAVDPFKGVDFIRLLPQSLTISCRQNNMHWIF